MSMLDPLAYSFAPPLPGYPELESVKLAVKVDRFEANAVARAEQARQGRLTLLALAVIVPILSFASLYAVAAVVDQGIQNWNSTRIANVEP